MSIESRMDITAQPDHAYTNTMCDGIIPTEFTYKMSNKEIENFVKLRISNSYLFSGLRNSSKWAWRAILKHMGLHHRMTHRQASKKFENLKKRYKELKNPPAGVKVVPQSWPFFSLMDDAMEGRLQSSAPILKALPNNSNVSDFLIAPTRKRRKVSNMEVSSAVDEAAGIAEIEVQVYGDEVEAAAAEPAESEEVNGSIPEVDISTNCEPRERKSEQLLMQREKPHQDVAALDRERALLERERAVTERERAVMERERAVMERERAVMEREQLMLEKDRDALRSERLVLEKEKAKWQRLLVQKERTEEITEEDSKVMNSDAVDKRERVLALLEKLAENI
ncbi:caldesmon isoform X1 [Xiphophorus couchianus]|uniref:caldesmon isoform X1 n=2 Tax=Xiphophorus couchianus TaxID=32473 RepID=UPI001016C3F6|nr:caldesmon-like isoform X1 [Xiphophorus couchianus]